MNRKISVIIPTYRREIFLQAIQSLQEQTCDAFEVLIVDNAASKQVEQQVRAHSDGLTLEYIAEPRLGLHFARHAGAKHASGEILVFTDDDATFDPNWIRAYADAFQAHPDMVAAGGPVRPVWDAPRPAWLVEYMGDKKTFGIFSLMEPYSDFRLANDGFFWGVNMAIRRQALFEVGGFNPESFGDIWLGDGESGLNDKLWQRGWLVGYVPEAVVFHHIPVSRMTPRYFRQRMANQGASDIYARYHLGIPSCKKLANNAVKSVIENFRVWSLALLLRDKTDGNALNLQMRAARTWSEFRYVMRLMTDAKLRELVVRTDWLKY